MDQMTLTLNSPITEEQWDMIEDIDFDHTDSITFHTKHGKEVEFVKRKTGEWNFIGNQMFECSECGICYTQSQFYQMRVLISDPEFPKFCPDCGASMMQGEQNVTD